VTLENLKSLIIGMKVIKDIKDGTPKEATVFVIPPESAYADKEWRNFVSTIGACARKSKCIVIESEIRPKTTKLSESDKQMLKFWVGYLGCVFHRKKQVKSTTKSIEMGMINSVRDAINTSNIDKYLKAKLLPLLLETSEQNEWITHFKGLMKLYGITNQVSLQTKMSQFADVRSKVLSYTLTLPIKPFLKSIASYKMESTQVVSKPFAQALNKAEIALVKDTIATRLKDLEAQLLRFSDRSETIQFNYFCGTRQSNEATKNVEKIHDLRAIKNATKAKLKQLVVNPRGELFGKCAGEVLKKDTQNKQKMAAFSKLSRAEQGSKANLRLQMLEKYNPVTVLSSCGLKDKDNDDVVAPYVTEDTPDKIRAYFARFAELKSKISNSAAIAVIDKFVSDFSIFTNTSTSSSSG
jgi:hypothetical protein